MAYKLELPTKLAVVPLIFHMLLLKKCIGDNSLTVTLDSIGVNDSL